MSELSQSPPVQHGARETFSNDSGVRFASALVLSKREAFELCEACAEAERALLRCGRAIEAARMAAIFEMVEARLVLAGA
jgi:hypothetical protein